jgi:hypothetical protein
MSQQRFRRVEAEPEIFRPVPGGWGSTNVRLAKAGPVTLGALTMAWQNIAPQSLAKPRAKSKA